MELHNAQLYQRLKARLAINPLALDEELINMPQLVIDIGEQVALCLSIRDGVKNDLDVITAEATAKLRQILIPTENAKGEIFDKPRSEKQLESEVPMQKTVKAATAALEDAKYDVAMWQVLMDAARTKSHATQKVADLTLSGYLTPDAAYHKQREKLAEKRDARRATMKA